MNLEELLKSNRRKQKRANGAKRKLGNRKKVWTKQSLEQATIEVVE